MTEFLLETILLALALSIDSFAAGFAYGAGQPSVGDAGHGPLHDGIFNAQKLCDTGLHESSSSSLSLRQHAP